MKKLLFLTFLAIIAILFSGCASESPTPTPELVTLEAESTVLSPGGHTSIQCHTSDAGDNFSYRWLSNGGEIKGEGTSVDWIAPDEPGNYAIAVEVSGEHGKSGTASLIITVRENHRPSISKLTTSENRFIPGGSYTIECLASDADGDALTYHWKANGGTISGEGQTITWTAPNAEGTYIITVIVVDETGGESTRFLSLNVAADHAPQIEDLVVTAEHKYLRDLGDYHYKVGKGETYTIECQARNEDNNNLLYTWSWDRGNIQGSGPVVTWIAPNVACDVTITVTVSDGRGGVATQDVMLKVVPCSHCAFGS